MDLIYTISMKREKSSGFTIIEVSLVLAIAGMILLMVFLALPALQRSQRDASRREAVMKVVSAIKNYQTNTGRGSIPGPDTSNVRYYGNKVATNTDAVTTWYGFYREFLGTDFKDPDGSFYNLWTINCTKVTPDTSCENLLDDSINTFGDHNFFIVIGSSCNGSTPYATRNPRKVSVLYNMESGGTYCANT